ncbi:hypothetical protein ABHC51_00040 [Ruminococcus bicirculans (ex Wegman et al. 2014)]|uniref:hypothetical protein n=1 Tax=Ruminococcus TaxID=1263 RepID=UPI002672D390
MRQADRYSSPVSVFFCPNAPIRPTSIDISHVLCYHKKERVSHNYLNDTTVGRKMDMNEKPKLLKKIKPVSNISNKIVVMEK